MQHLEFDEDFTLPVERIYAFLSEHENLGIIFAPMKVERRTDGTDSRNGVGSSRTLTLAGQAPFVETVTEEIPNQRIVYKITEGSPLKNHQGVLEFSPTPTGCHVHYTIEFASKIPGLDVMIAQGLKRGVAKGLAKVEARISENA